MVSANEHRSADDPLVKAKKAARLLDLGSSEEDAAIAFGVTKQTIKSWTSLLSASKKVQRAVGARLLSPTAAVKLAKLSKDEQDVKLSELVLEGKPTVERARRVVKGDSRNGDLPRAPSRKTLRNLVAVSDLDEQIKALLRWITGDAADSDIPQVIKEAVERLEAAK